VFDEYLKVYDIDGTQKVVNAPNGWGYLNTSMPGTSIRATTVADYTFIVNREITVAKASTKSPAQSGKGIVFVKGAYSGCKYEVYINGTLAASYNVGLSDAPKSDVIAQSLYNQLVAALPSGSWSVAKHGPIIVITRLSGSSFILKTEDSRSGEALIAIMGTVRSVADLPAFGPNGYVVRVNGDETTDFEDYYLKFVPLNAGEAVDRGNWEETVKPDVHVELDPATMPHILVREADGTFTFKQAVWDKRIVGDDDTVPFPSFVGQKINDVFFYRNRLGLLAGETVCLSEAGEFFNFFKTSARQLVDTDPIDVSVGHTKVSILQHGVPWNKRLLLFSEQTQFIMDGGEALTPETAAVAVATEFEVSKLVRPVSAGPNIYMASDARPYARVREYYIAPESGIEDAAEVTAHVPRYIPAGVTRMSASPFGDILVLLTNGAPKSIYTYNYYWRGTEKLQSAWSVWTFDWANYVRSADFIGTDLYAIVDRDDGAHLIKIETASGTQDVGLTYTTHLDIRTTEATCTRTYNSTTDETTITLPYSIGASEIVVVSRDSELPGETASVMSASGNTVVVNGDWSARQFFVGVPYTMRFVFSRIMPRHSGDQVALTGNRVQLRSMTLQVERTGYLKCRVTVVGNPGVVYTSEFAGRVLGAETALIGAVSLVTGSVKFPLLVRSDGAKIELINDTFLPCAIVSCDVEAFYTARARRL
jgi:hypothetical protein